MWGRALCNTRNCLVPFRWEGGFIYAPTFPLSPLLDTNAFKRYYLPDMKGIYFLNIIFSIIAVILLYEGIRGIFLQKVHTKKVFDLYIIEVNGKVAIVVGIIYILVAILLFSFVVKNL